MNQTNFGIFFVCRDSRNEHISVEKVKTYLCGVEQIKFLKNVGQDCREGENISNFVREVETYLNWVEQIRTFFLGRENQNTPKFDQES